MIADRPSHHLVGHIGRGDVVLSVIQSGSEFAQAVLAGSEVLGPAGLAGGVGRERGATAIFCLGGRTGDVAASCEEAEHPQYLEFGYDHSVNLAASVWGGVPGGGTVLS